MEWLRMHPYSSALSAAFLLLVAGGFLVMKKSSAPALSTNAVAWGGAGAVLNPSVTPTPSATSGTLPITQQTEGAPPYTYILPAPQTTNTDQAQPADGFDFDAFISLLTQQPASNAAGAQDSSAAGNAYAFIPTGLVSNVTPATRTKVQQALYEYGNEIGSLIQSFELEHPNESQVVMDQAQDRNDAGKAATVQALGKALSALGDSILLIDNVPSQMVSGHQALAKSYQDLGQKLVLVPGAQGDTAFITAVKTYNSSADSFVKNYVSLADLFAAYGVVFSPGDAGSVFTFTQTAL